MSFSINKVKESLGLLSTPEIYTTAAIKRFPGAFSMGTSQRCNSNVFFFLPSIFFFQSSSIHRRSIPTRSWHLQRDRYQKRSSQMEIFHFSKNHFFSRPKPLPLGVHNIKLYCIFPYFYVCQIKIN